MFTAKQLMTEEPMTVQTNDDPQEILNRFLENKITAMPVADQKGEIIGVLSEMNLVKIMVQYLMDGKNKKLGNYTKMLDKAVSVYEDADLGEVIKTLVASSTHRTLVRNNMEKVVGIVSPKDLLKKLTNPQ